jgi:MerR family transcriptional regulator, thiopeptide resistance regulator
MLRVGELAAATGVTVRTLHHYEETGLLISSGRTEGGHRVFGPEGVERVYQVRALRELGFSLVEIGNILEGGSATNDLLASHLVAVEQELERLRLLRERLRSLTSRDYTAADVEELIATLEAMSCVELHRKRRDIPVGSEALRGEAWSRLGKDLRANMDAGIGPLDKANALLAQQAKSLREQFSNGNSKVVAALKRLRTLKPPDQEDFAGWDAPLMEYLSAALAGLSVGGK